MLIQMMIMMAITIIVIIINAAPNSAVTSARHGCRGSNEHLGQTAHHAGPVIDKRLIGLNKSDSFNLRQTC